MICCSTLGLFCLSTLLAIAYFIWMGVTFVFHRRAFRLWQSRNWVCLKLKLIRKLTNLELHHSGSTQFGGIDTCKWRCERIARTKAAKLRHFWLLLKRIYYRYIIALIKFNILIIHNSDAHFPIICKYAKWQLTLTLLWYVILCKTK